jgi:O-antigen ligase
MFKKYYLKSCELLFLIFPISIVFSNFIANLTVYYLAFFGIYIFFKEEKYIKKNILYLVLIFWVYISLRSLFTTEILFSLKSSLPLIRYLFFIIAVSYLINNVKNLIRNFSIIFFFFISFLFLDAIIQFSFKKNLFGYTEEINNRISSFFNGRFVLGSYISKITLLSLILLNIFLPFKKFKLFYMVVIFVSVFIVLISGDRASLGLYLLSLITILVLIDKKYISYYQKALSLILILIFTFSLVYSIDSFKKRFFFQTLSDVKRADKIFYFSRGHQSHWQTSYKMFRDNKVFGKGPNMFRFYCDLQKFNSGEKSCSTHPHNYHIQLLSETGLIGYFLFLFVFLSLIFILIKQFYFVYFKRKSLLSFNKIIILSLSFSNFWPIITTGNIFSSFTLNLVFISLGFYFLDEKKYYK